MESRTASPNITKLLGKIHDKGINTYQRKFIMFRTIGGGVRKLKIDNYL